MMEFLEAKAVGKLRINCFFECAFMHSFPLYGPFGTTVGAKVSNQRNLPAQKKLHL